MSQFTQREFLYLDDALQATQVEVKCFSDLAHHAVEPAVRDICLNLSQMHARHFERLARHMNAGQGQVTPQPTQWAQNANPSQPSQGTWSGRTM